MRSFFKCLPAFSVILASACQSSVSPIDVSVTTAPSNTSLRAGTPIQIGITVANLSEQTRTIVSSPCPEAFIVLKADGTIVGPSEKICSLAGPTNVELKRGESFTTAFPWYGDARGGSIKEPADLLPPGTYFVRARVLIEGAGEVLGNAVEVRISQ